MSITSLRAHANQQRFVQRVSDTQRTCGWLLREVATLTGLDRSSIWQIVNGRRRPCRDALILPRLLFSYSHEHLIRTNGRRFALGSDG